MKIKLKVVVDEFFPPDVDDGHYIFERTVSAQILPEIGERIPICNMEAVAVFARHPLSKGVLVHEMTARISVKNTRGGYFDSWRNMNQWVDRVLHPLMEKEGFRFTATHGLDGE